MIDTESVGGVGGNTQQPIIPLRPSFLGGSEIQLSTCSTISTICGGLVVYCPGPFRPSKGILPWHTSFYLQHNYMLWCCEILPALQ